MTAAAPSPCRTTLTTPRPVHLTREPRGGSQAPSEEPILTVKL